ncbi:hypothetical protein [Bradyrhizobium sp. URHC0002]
MQRHVAAAGDGGQCGAVPHLVGSSLLDPNEADFAAVIETKAAPIDHGGDTAFALRLERAIGGVGRSDGCQHEK